MKNTSTHQIPKDLQSLVLASKLHDSLIDFIAHYFYYQQQFRAKYLYFSFYYRSGELDLDLDLFLFFLLFLILSCYFLQNPVLIIFGFAGRLWSFRRYCRRFWGRFEPPGRFRGHFQPPFRYFDQFYSSDPQLLYFITILEITFSEIGVHLNMSFPYHFWKKLLCFI